MQRFYSLLIICFLLIQIPVFAQSYDEKLLLAKSYMQNNQFSDAQNILESLCAEFPDDKEIAKAYLLCALAQHKTYDAYYIARTHNLLETKEGYIALGDLSLSNKKYGAAAHNYFNALQLEPDNLILKNKLAQTYQFLGYIKASTKLFCDVLAKDPQNLQAMLGLGYIELEKKNFKKSRKIFCEILEINPEYKPAKIGIVNSYLANGDGIKALETIKNLPQDADAKLLKAKAYYGLNMFSDSKKSIPVQKECEKCDLSRYFVDRGSGTKNNLESKGVDDNDKAQESEPLLAPLGESDLYVIPGLPEHKFTREISSAKVAHATISENAKELAYQLRRNEALSIVPGYSFLFQQLAEEFDLDYHKFGVQMSKATEGNKNVFLEYNVIVYTSGHTPSPNGPKLNNVVNEFKGGVQARPNTKWEYSANMGVKAFQFGNNGMLITDSWIKHYFNDKFNLKLGYRRNNIEQSYLSAVGELVDGVFTGQSADNKVYLEFEGRLPKGFYTFGRGGYGVICSQNLRTNQYTEGLLGIGRVLYSNPRNKFVKLVGADITSYNSAYQYNQISVYGRNRQLFGGYFSPSFFNANTLNLKVEGEIPKYHIKYGLRGFGGIQTSMSPDSTTPTWGVAPYISYDLNDRVSLNASYSFYNYASVQRNLFIINAVIRCYRKHAKS